MASRIEITFTFDAPDDEMARAKLLGRQELHAAADALRDALKSAGAEPAMVARFVKSVPARANSGRRPKLAAAE